MQHPDRWQFYLLNHDQCHMKDIFVYHVPLADIPVTWANFTSAHYIQHDLHNREGLLWLSFHSPWARPVFFARRISQVAINAMLVLWSSRPRWQWFVMNRMKEWHIDASIIVTVKVLSARKKTPACQTFETLTKKLSLCTNIMFMFSHTITKLHSSHMLISEYAWTLVNLYSQPKRQHSRHLKHTDLDLHASLVYHTSPLLSVCPSLSLVLTFQDTILQAVSAKVHPRLFCQQSTFSKVWKMRYSNTLALRSKWILIYDYWITLLVDNGAAGILRVRRMKVSNFYEQEPEVIRRSDLLHRLSA